MRSLPQLQWLFVAGLAFSAGAGCQGFTPIASPSAAGDLETTVYLTETEGLATVLPATRRVSELVALSGQERREVESLLGGRMVENEFTVHAGLRADGSLDGFAVIHSEIGKFKPFDFVVGIEPDGTVRRVAILVYRESRGNEISQRRFHRQYVGKRVSDPLRINQDILNVSGATMSVQSLNVGVKKVLAVIQAVYLNHPERLARLLASTPVAVQASAAPTEREAFTAPQEVREARLVMGALCEIRAYGVDAARVRQGIFAAFEAIEAADRALSDYRPHSELSALSRQAGGPWCEVSPLTGEFLQLAKQVSEVSNGACDLTIGPLVHAWGGRGAVPRSPRPDELSALRPLVDWRAIELRGGAGTAWQARLLRPGMRLDPGALGKGHAVDLAVRRLRAAGIESALVDFSGNFFALGSPPSLPAWRVAVRDPVHPEMILGIASLRDQGIASSGGYARQGQVGGAPCCHIISPTTLEPVTDVFGSTVVAPTAALADGFATAAFVLGREALAFLMGQAGVEGLVAWKNNDGKTEQATTPGWRLKS